MEAGKPMQVEPGYSISGDAAGAPGYKWTCYGIKDETIAHGLASRAFAAGLVTSVEVVKTWKMTKQSRWSKKIVLSLGTKQGDSHDTVNGAE